MAKPLSSKAFIALPHPQIARAIVVALSICLQTLGNAYSQQQNAEGTSQGRDWLTVGSRAPDKPPLLLRIDSILHIQGLVRFETSIESTHGAFSGLNFIGSRDTYIHEFTLATCTSNKAHTYRRIAINRNDNSRRTLLEEPPNEALMVPLVENSLLTTSIKVACSWKPDYLKSAFPPSSKHSAAWQVVSKRGPDNAEIFLDTANIRRAYEDIAFVIRVPIGEQIESSLRSLGFNPRSRLYEWYAANCQSATLAPYASEVIDDRMAVVYRSVGPREVSLRSSKPGSVAADLLKEACRIDKLQNGSSATSVTLPGIEPSSDRKQRLPIRLDLEFLPLSPAPKWHKDNSSNESLRHIDLSSLREKGERITAWLQFTSNSLGIGRKTRDALSALRLSTFNCSERESALLVEYLYQDKFISGTLIDEYRAPIGSQMSTPIKGSQDDAELQFVCRTHEQVKAKATLETVDDVGKAELASTLKDNRQKAVPAGTAKRASPDNAAKKPAPQRTYSNPF